MTSAMNRFTSLLGPYPEQGELNVSRKVEKSFPRYTLERICYYVESKERVSAFLLIPHQIKFPGAAIFCHHQHNGEWHIGKSEPAGLAGDPDQHIAKELAERGFVTFAPDALGFEERNDGKDHEHSYREMTNRLLKGETYFAKLIHDIRRGVDVLFELEELSITQLGFIGHSYGGKMALMAPLFDDRIKATVSNCGCITWKDSLKKEAGVQMELAIPELLNYLDLEDLVKEIRDCSVLISATHDDVWSMSAQDIYEQCKGSFRKGDLALRMYEGGHVFTKEMREVAYEFLISRLGDV